MENRQIACSPEYLGVKKATVATKRLSRKQNNSFRVKNESPEGKQIKAQVNEADQKNKHKFKKTNTGFFEKQHVVK